MAMGGYLVSAKTSWKHKLLKTRMKFTNTRSLWLGLTDIDVEGEFVWDEDGTALDPDDGYAEMSDVLSASLNTEENCVFIGDSGLQVVGCDKEMRFICEMMTSI